MSIKQLILTVGVLAACVATAASSTFPNSDGSGNIMSRAAWGGADVPTANTIVVGEGTYFFDPVGTLGGLKLSSGTAVFDQTKSTQSDQIMGINGRIVAADNTTMRFVGGKYKTPGNEVFKNEKNSTIEVTGGAQITFTNSFVFCGSTASDGNVLRVSGEGSKISFSGYFGYWSGGNGKNGVIEGLDGATVQVSDALNLYAGSGYGFLISNATFTCNNWYCSGATNCFIHVQGNKPSMRLSASGKKFAGGFSRGFHLIYDIPEEGYAYEGDTDADCPIYSLGDGADASLAVKIEAGTTLTLNGVPAYQSYLRRQGVASNRFRILCCYGGGYDGCIKEDVLANWRATLPEGTSLYCPTRNSSSADQNKYGRGRTLLLTVTGFVGFTPQPPLAESEIIAVTNVAKGVELAADAEGEYEALPGAIVRVAYTLPEGIYFNAAGDLVTTGSTDVTIPAGGGELAVPLDPSLNTGVARIGEVKYGSVPRAIAAAKDGETVTLLQSVSSAETVTIDGGDTAETKKQVTLDLAGFTLTASKATGYGLIVKGVDLTVTGDSASAQGFRFKRLRAEGTGTVLKFGRSAETQIGGYGNPQVNRLIEAADGAKINPRYSKVNLGGDASSYGNVVRAVGEGSVVQLPTSMIGYSGSYSNLLEAVDGGKVTCTYYEYEGKMNGLVCSNGWVSIDQYTRMGQDNFACVSGSRPRLVLSTGNSSQGHKLTRNFKLMINLPATGYDYGGETVVPVSGTSNNSSNDGTMSIELTGMTDYVMHFVEQKVWRHRMRLVSLKNAGFTQAMVDAWNEPLANTGVTLVRVGGEDIDLVYKVPREYAPGMMLIFR